jgi:hypothetical protein
VNGGPSHGTMTRAELYAERVVEGKVTPAHTELRMVAEISESAEQHARAELAITADMEWLKAQLTMAFAIGYGAGVEDRTRRGARR